MEIADKAQNTRQVQQGGEGNEFLGGLDEAERQRKLARCISPFGD